MLSGIVLPVGFPSLPDPWTSSGTTWTSPVDQTPLFETVFAKKDGARKSVLAVVHGQGEHGGRYAHFPHYVKDEVDAVVALDLRGHGRSSGIRGHVERFDAYTDDVFAWISRLKQTYTDVHFLGHSMGGLIGLRLLKNQPDVALKSVCISAPLLGLSLPVPAIKRWVGLALSNVWGELQLGTGIDASLVSHDPEVVRAYKMDRLNHDRATPRFFTQMQAASADTAAWRGPVRRPVMFVIPTSDGIVDAPLNKHFAESLEADVKEIHFYEGFFHEAFNEVGKERVFSDLQQWLRKNST